MIPWLKHKKHPEIWQKYLETFKNVSDQTFDSVRFVVLDTETTGLDIKNDRILSIGAIAINGFSLDVADAFEVYLAQDTFKPETVEVHGLLKTGNIEKSSEEKAISAFLSYVKNAVIVAHHKSFDLAMLNKTLKRMGLPKLKNKSLDTGLLFEQTKRHTNRDKPYSLDELADIYNIPKHDRHTASGDAFITGLVFLKIVTELRQIPGFALKNLFRRKRIGLL